MHLTARLSPWGFDVETTLRFSTSRVWRAGTFVLAGRSYPAGLYPNDGTDDDGPPRPVHVKAGTTVTVSTKVAASCAARPTPPVLLIRSQPDGGPVREDWFHADDPATYASALAAWCREGVQATPQSSSLSPSGRDSVVLRLVNPGVTTVRVTSSAYTVGSSSWQAASVAVPPAGSARLRIAATGVACRDGSTPWQTGHLSSGGSALSVYDGDQWC